MIVYSYLCNMLGISQFILNFERPDNVLQIPYALEVWVLRKDEGSNFYIDAISI